jgi:integrase
LSRSAFISRREGRYLFRARLPACLSPKSGSAFRISLRTADYKTAKLRAARIASWMLSVKVAEDPESALLALWPRLQALAAEPVRGEEDLVDRAAFQGVAFEAQYRVRLGGHKPDQVVPGWEEYFVALVRENSRANNEREKSSTVLSRIEQKRALYAAAASPAPPPTGCAAPAAPDIRPPTSAATSVDRYTRRTMSEVLKEFLDAREQQDGDRRADSDIEPVVRFVIELLSDPVMLDFNGDHLLTVKKALPAIPTPRGFAPSERSLYFRWRWAAENGWTREKNRKTIQLKRVSETTLIGRYESGLNTFWKFAIEHWFAYEPAPNFESTSKYNPPAAERDAFKPDELYKFFASPPFTGCHGIARRWTPGAAFVQDYFYWAELIEVLCGMRPSEIAQLRCRDILDLYGKPHFRYAPLSVEQQEKDRFDPQTGGTRGKSPSAFRWAAIHWLIIRLGIKERRDAIVAAFISRKVAEFGGRKTLSAEQLDDIEVEAHEQWLFPDWKVYVKNTGEIKWSHVLTKAFTYGIEKLEMNRAGLVNYSGRHTFKGFLDDLEGLSERSRLVVFGHSTKKDVSSRYGPKFISEEQSEIVQKLSSKQIWRLALILIRAKRKAECGELKTVNGWRDDQRARDVKLQRALAKRKEQYS